MERGCFYKSLYVVIILSCVGFLLFFLTPFDISDIFVQPRGYLDNGESFSLRIPEDRKDGESFSTLSVGAHPLTIQPNGGRLGNQMFTYATLFGLSTLNRRPMQITPSVYLVLSKYFDIRTSVLNEAHFTVSNPWEIGNWLTNKDLSIPLTSNYITGNTYPTSFTFFDHIRQGIREVFRFKPSFKKYAQDILWRVKDKQPHTQVYVGIHVRRGDYLKHSDGGWLRAYDGREVDREFFVKAMEHFTSKYRNVTFLAVSDDREWCRQNLSDLGISVTPDSPSAGHDLALLTECNHTIMTYGTYGFWGGYLGGGEVVYFADFLKPNTKFVKDYFRYDKMYPAEWRGISTTRPGYWESYINPFLT